MPVEQWLREQEGEALTYGSVRSSPYRRSLLRILLAPSRLSSRQQKTLRSRDDATRSSKASRSPPAAAAAAARPTSAAGRIRTDFFSRMNCGISSCEEGQTAAGERAGRPTDGRRCCDSEVAPRLSPTHGRAAVTEEHPVMCGSA